MGRERAQVIYVDRGNDRAAGKISDCDEECIDRVLGTTSGRPEQPARANTRRRVHRMNENAFPPKLAKYGGVSGSAANEFSEHSRDGRNRKLPLSHLMNECADAVATTRRTLCDRYDYSLILLSRIRRRAMTR